MASIVISRLNALARNGRYRRFAGDDRKDCGGMETGQYLASRYSR
jgi:hypothetical protein